MPNTFSQSQNTTADKQGFLKPCQSMPKPVERLPKNFSESPPPSVRRVSIFQIPDFNSFQLLCDLVTHLLANVANSGRHDQLKQCRKPCTQGRTLPMKGLGLGTRFHGERQRFDTNILCAINPINHFFFCLLYTSRILYDNAMRTPRTPLHLLEAQGNLISEG